MTKIRIFYESPFKNMKIEIVTALIQRENNSTNEGKMAGSCQYDTQMAGIGLN